MSDQHPTLEQICDYVHGELSPHQDAAVHAHLSGCPSCSEMHETEAGLGELLRGHARAHELELPPGFAERIVRAAVASDAAAVPLWDRVRAALRPAVAIPVAAAVALAIYFGAVSPHGSTAQGPAVDATAYIESHAALATSMPFADGVPATFAADVASEGTAR